MSKTGPRRPQRWPRRCCCSASCCCLRGLVFRLGLLVYAMYAMLGVLLISRFLARMDRKHFGGSAVYRATAQVGEKAAVVVTVRNTGRFTAAWLLIEDSLSREALLQRPPRIQVDGRRTKLLKLKSGSEASLMYQVDVCDARLLPDRPAGGGERRPVRAAPPLPRFCTEPHFVMVYPKVVPLDGYDFASRRPIGEVRLTHRLFEDPTRIAGVRQYQKGDPLNRIHWRATARTGGAAQQDLRAVDGGRGDDLARLPPRLVLRSAASRTARSWP